MTKAADPALKHTCRVLIALDEGGEQTRNDIAERTGLDVDQVHAALAWLRRKQKVQAFVPAGAPANQYVYEFNEDYTPPKRAKRVRSKSEAGKAANKEEAPRPHCFEAIIRKREEKVAFLRRLLPRVAGRDEDLLIGIINDYARDALQNRKT